MPRVPRSYSKSHYYHVMVQGIAKERIFQDNKLKLFYLKRLKENAAQSGIEILAYCFMPNHAHFVIKCLDIQKLSTVMQQNNVAYALYYNSTLNRVGYVFRNRYRSEEIKDENSLLRCIVYVHCNPVKAGICKWPSEYQWSSWQEYMVNKEIITGARQILQEISRSIDNAREIFKKFHEVDVDEKWIDVIEYEGAGCVDELIQDYSLTVGKNIKEIIKNRDLLTDLVKHLQVKTGISFREAARMLNVNRETLRKVMSNSPSR